MEIKPIATIKTDFESKFGVPRQSAKGSSLIGTVVFNAEFSSAEAVRGLSEYTHIWLIWGFSKNNRNIFHPTVRPPMLGGNKRVGVFATRSPFRPNSLAMSAVELISVCADSAPVTLTVKGIDMVNGTPIYDIKPYIPYTDCVKNAKAAAFCEAAAAEKFEVTFAEHAKSIMPQEKEEQLIEILSANPKPAYIADKTRVFCFEFSGYKISFTAADNEIYVTSIALC
ncbi:MAG: tRNA (N6-threonylcarbamoyladenosine(37)-N6)-methyltransferase TrmO [Clostridiales bacterium]|nr:tRNA (N6-threonylcarbamoyladenosine(37)-N6)-methyltransferase TrmO [Clostridiales bacterium]